jgi:hypothetical protein
MFSTIGLCVGPKVFWGANGVVRFGDHILISFNYLEWSSNQHVAIF